MVVKEFLPEEIQGTWKKIKKIVYSAIAGVGLMYGIIDSVYTVPTDSVGVIQRFGKYIGTTDSGIHAKWPLIDTVTDVPVKRVQKEEFGFRTLRAGIDTQFLGVDELASGKIAKGDLENLILDAEQTPNEGDVSGQAKKVLQSEYLMLTGDLNMADVEWIVQYVIKDPVAYLFGIREPGRTLRDVSQAVTRKVVGNGSVDEVITIGRIEYEASIKEEMQKLLDLYQTGHHIVTVKMQSSNPPGRVRPAFNRVNESMQQRETRISEAQGNYNDAIPRAGGEALGIIKKAEGYAIERVNKAQGDVSKFEKVYEAYAKTPEISLQRMYFESMNNILSHIPEKWIIEQKGAEGGILQKLELNPVG